MLCYHPGPFPALSLQTAYCQAAAVRHFRDGRAKHTVRRSCITSGTGYGCTSGMAGSSFVKEQSHFEELLYNK